MVELLAVPVDVCVLSSVAVDVLLYVGVLALVVVFLILNGR